MRSLETEDSNLTLPPRYYCTKSMTNTIRRDFGIVLLDWSIQHILILHLDVSRTFCCNYFALVKEMSTLPARKRGSCTQARGRHAAFRKFKIWSLHYIYFVVDTMYQVYSLKFVGTSACTITNVRQHSNTVHHNFHRSFGNARRQITGSYCT